MFLFFLLSLYFYIIFLILFCPFCWLISYNSLGKDRNHLTLHSISHLVYSSYIVPWIIMIWLPLDYEILETMVCSFSYIVGSQYKLNINWPETQLSPVVNICCLCSSKKYLELNAWIVYSFLFHLQCKSYSSISDIHVRNPSDICRYYFTSQFFRYWKWEFWSS